MDRDEFKNEITEMSTEAIAGDCDQILMRMQVAKRICTDFFGIENPSQDEIFRVYNEMRVEETSRVVGQLARTSLKGGMGGLGGFGGGDLPPIN